MNFVSPTRTTSTQQSVIEKQVTTTAVRSLHSVGRNNPIPNISLKRRETPSTVNENEHVTTCRVIVVVSPPECQTGIHSTEFSSRG